MRGSTAPITSRAWVYALLIRESVMADSLEPESFGHARGPQACEPCDLDRTTTDRHAWTPPRRLTWWQPVSHNEISSCGMGVHSLRLLDMVSASTHTHLVVRRHVDLMRVGSMTCWHR